MACRRQPQDKVSGGGLPGWGQCSSAPRAAPWQTGAGPRRWGAEDVKVFSTLLAWPPCGWGVTLGLSFWPPAPCDVSWTILNHSCVSLGRFFTSVSANVEHGDSRGSQSGAWEHWESASEC